MYFTLTAQPIGEDGIAGFEDRGPLVEHGTSITETFFNMGNTLMDYTGLHQTWDLKLEVKL